MEWTTYLEHVRSDASRLSEVALLGLDADVPSCAGWTVGDLVRHVATVYTHKSMIVEEGWTERQDRPISPPDGDVSGWFDASAAHLLDVLADHDPSESVWTWVEDDQTVGFWYRRMAHETLIHRIDAEQAHGLDSDVNEDLAADGIDEILNVMMSGGPSWASCQFGRCVARLEVPGRSWTIRLGSFSGISPNTQITYTDEPTLEVVESEGEFQTVVSGSASALDQWLWGRASPRELTIQGDRTLATELRAIAREATQ